MSALEDDYPALVTVDRAHYSVSGELARGGMGRVLRARDRRLGRPVAIKELLVDDPGLQRRLEREARIAARLQHPSAVAVYEAGRWPNGDVFYAMNLVAGQSLDKVIVGSTTADARLALVANVLAVVDTIAYAHSMRIIHRDLKPANVLVGKFGETVVIDWGLAKDLGEADDPNEPMASTASAGANGETIEGAVLGTPAYMPKEQAEGLKVDERADVYALGAMLYHVLTGVPPYLGVNTAAVLAQVLAGPPPALERLAPRLPGDLLTIVNKAMARDAADRYPSAQELAADLRRFQTGQLVASHRYTAMQLARRWLERNRTSLTVAAVAFAIIVTGSIIGVRNILEERNRAEQQRVLAEANRGESDGLLDFMLGELKSKLEPVGKLELLGSVAKRAVEHERAGGRDMTTPDARHRRFTARLNLGEVMSDQGDLAGAISLFREAQQTALLSVLLDPEDDNARHDLARAYGLLGVALLAQSDQVGAEHALTTEYALSLAGAKAAPNERRWQQMIGASSVHMASLADIRGDARKALEYRRASLAAYIAFAGPQPTRDATLAIAGARQHLSEALITAADKEGALAELRAALALVEAEAVKDPRDAELQRAAWTLHSKIGDSLLRNRDVRGALAANKIAAAIAVRMAAADPIDTEWQRSVLISSNKLGSVLRATGDLPGAIVQFQTARAINERLVELDPTNAVLARDLSVTLVQLGDAFIERKDLEAAQTVLEQAAAIPEQLAAAAPAHKGHRRDRALTSTRLAAVLLKRGQHDAAIARFRTGLQVFEELAREDAANDRLQRDVSLGHEQLGDAFLAKGDRATAVAEYRAALAISEARLARSPGDVDVLADVGEGHKLLADTFLAIRDRTRAKSSLRAAIEVFAVLARTQPDNPDWEAERSTLVKMLAKL